MTDLLQDAMASLLGRTRSGDVRWRPTEQRNAVSVAMHGATLVLVNHQVAETDLVTLQDMFPTTLPPRPKGITLELRNPEGKVVGRNNVGLDQPGYEDAKDLWRRAYDTAYHVSETYDALSKGLSADGPVGR